MEFNEVYQRVRTAISDSCGIDEEMIQPDSTLFGDLKVDSIDMVDILFILESEFKITLKVNDIHAVARMEMGDEPYEVDGVISESGIAKLKEKFPELDGSKITQGLTIHELLHLITVKSLCMQVLGEINKAANANDESK